MDRERVLIDGDWLEIRQTSHYQERMVERGILPGTVEDMVLENYDQLLDLKLNEELKLVCQKTGVVAPITIDVVEDLGEWITVVYVKTVWVNEKLIGGRK